MFNWYIPLYYLQYKAYTSHNQTLMKFTQLMCPCWPIPVATWSKTWAVAAHLL